MLFRQIEYLHAIMECGNFYMAAEKLHVSQSAISQQIRKLEDELGVQLLERHNRTFSLTPAGELFYKKSLVIRSDIEQMIRETKRRDVKDSAKLRLGYYKGYHGNEFSEAVSEFSEKYPTVEISIISGSHDELYHGMIEGHIDLSLNDQRRAFSSAFNNLILSQSKTYVQISSRNPLSKLNRIEAPDLKNLPCILILNLPRLKSRGSQPRILTDSDSLGYPRNSYGSYICYAPTRSPSFRMLIAAFTSLSCTEPHSGHIHSLTDKSFVSVFLYPQQLQS